MANEIPNNNIVVIDLVIYYDFLRFRLLRAQHISKKATERGKLTNIMHRIGIINSNALKLDESPRLSDNNLIYMTKAINPISPITSAIPISNAAF